VDLRRERLTAEFLDPRRNFEPTRVPLEVRWDPLTGQSSELLPAGSLPRPEQYDLDPLAMETRPTCPFCAERIEVRRPAFCQSCGRRVGFVAAKRFSSPTSFRTRSGALSPCTRRSIICCASTI
jgi:hypothetical protein